MIPYSNTLSGLLEPCGENILSFRVRVTRTLANQRPVFESRDMAWPIRGQIHSCHPPPLWPPVHIWLPPDKTSLRPDIISTRSSMSVTIKYLLLLSFSPWCCPELDNLGQSQPVVGCNSQSGEESKKKQRF